MRLVRFRHGRAEPASGVLVGDTVHALDGDLFESPRTGLAVAPLAEVTLLAPCMPGQVISVGANYADRCRENELEIPSEPGRHDSFLVPGVCVVGPGAPIRLPPWEPHVEYSAELGVVMRRACHAVPVARIPEHVLGYTALNNLWAKTRPRVPSALNIRVYDSFCPVGPWIETAIEPTDLGLRLRLNGQLRQDSRTSKMLFDVFTVIAFVSARIPLAAGDLVMTATPSGVGRIAPGDVVEVDIEGIGVVGNPVVLDPSVAERPLARI